MAAGFVIGAAFAPGLAAAGNIHAECLAAPADCGSINSAGNDVLITYAEHPNFDFRKTGSDAAGTGHLFLDVLIPNNALNAAGMNLSIDCSSGCGNSAASGNLFSNTAWTSGKLDDYLGISASPQNPIGAWLGLTQNYDAGASGYFVYKLDFGAVNFGSAAPTFNFNYNLPVGALITGFFYSDNCGKQTPGKGKKPPCWLATPNSEAMMLDQPPQSVPEPLSLSLFGVGLIAMGVTGRRRRKHAPIA